MSANQEALDIILRLQGVPTYTGGMGEASGANDKFAASSQRAAQMSNEAAAASERQRGAAALVSKGLKYTSVALLAVAADSVRLAVKWNDLGKTISQTTGLTGKSLDDLMETISKTSEHAPYALGEVADAAILLKTKFGQSDRQIEQTSGLLIAFAERAKGTAKDVGTSALSILQDFRVGAAGLRPLMDQLTSVSQSTQKPMGDLLGVIEKYGPKLQAMGFSLTDTIRMLGVFQASGVPTSMMGRGLSSALTSAQKTSKETGEGIPEIIKRRISEVAHATSQQQAYALALEYFGKQVGPSFARALFHNAGAIAEVEKAMSKSGATQGLLSAQQKELGGQYQELKNQLDAYLRTIGKEFIPVLMDALKDTRSFAGGLMTLTDHGKLLAPIVLALVSAWLAYKAATIASAIATTAWTVAQGAGALVMAASDAALTAAIVALYAWDVAVGIATAAQWALNVAMDANPIGLIVLGIAAVIASIVLLILHFHQVVNFLRGPWGTIAVLLTGPFAPILLIALHFKKVKSAAASVVNWIKTNWGKIGHILAWPFEQLWNKASWVAKHIKGLFGKGGGGILSHIDLSSALKSIPTIGPILGAIPHFASGGVMPFGGMATINEGAQGETVYLPGGSRVQPGSASSLLSPRAHTPNPAPSDGDRPIYIDAWLQLPGGAGRTLFKLITKEAAISEARS